MSVNLNISFEIHNIKEIHTEEGGIKSDEIYEAANKFLEEAGLSDQDMIVDFAGQDGNLIAYNAGPPIIVSKSYLWVPELTKKWKELAIQILGPTCEPLVKIEYPDDELDQEELPHETSQEQANSSLNNKPWWKFW